LLKAVKLYAQKYKHLQQACCHISEVSLRAVRRAGELLVEMDLKPGPKQDGDRMSRIGVTRKQSSRWQRIAAITDDRFESYIESCLAKNKPCTAASLRNERRLRPHNPATRSPACSFTAIRRKTPPLITAAASRPTCCRMTSITPRRTATAAHVLGCVDRLLHAGGDVLDLHAQRIDGYFQIVYT
jgi:hypothetical protein